MKPTNLFKSLLWALAGAVTLTWIACDPPYINVIDQPDNAGCNEAFGVDLTVSRSMWKSQETYEIISNIGFQLPAEWAGLAEPGKSTVYRLIFGVQLPIGWTVEDHINFTGADEGVFNYSGELSAGMESQYPPDPSYYWWVGEMPETIDTAYGEIFFTPVITTDDQQGNFYLDYSIGYWSDTVLTLSSALSSDHLITAGLPETVHVRNTENSGPGSLRAALDSVSQGGTILFNLTFPATITLLTEIPVYKNVNINGPENASLTLSGNNSCRIFHVLAGKKLGLADLELANGFAHESIGGAVILDDRSGGSFTRVDFINNHSDYGGGAIFGRNIEMLSIHQSLISGNSSGQSGSALYLENYSYGEPGIFLLGNSEISGNTGGAISISGPLTCHIYGSEIAGNECSGHGGGIFAVNLNNLLLSETDIHDNAGQYGGGLYLDGIQNLDLDHVRIYENQADIGGGIMLGYFNIQDTISFSAVTVRNNSANGNGGGIHSEYDLNIRFDETSRCNIYSNWAVTGPEWYHSNYNLNSISLPVILDTFTVIQPNDYFAWPLHAFSSFDIQHTAIQQIDQDVYVSPGGSNSNTGTSPSSPFKTISHALKFIIADPADPNTIHLAPGTYSEQGNGESFPLYTRSATRISGQDKENTIIETMDSDYVFQMDYDQGVQFEQMNFKGMNVQNSSVEAAGFITSGIRTYNSAVELTDGMVKVKGLYTGNSDITCNNVAFRDNHLAALIYDSTTLNLNGCMIEENGYTTFDQYKGGIRIGGDSHLNLSGTTIRNNYSPEPGGGIYIENATAWFDPANRCNIYNNLAYYGTDLYAENPGYYFQIKVDTFSVLNPTDYYAFPLQNFYLYILNGKTPQVSADLYVSPDGSDDNSGLSPEEPLKSISKGLRIFLPDYDEQHTLHLAPGDYSAASTGEHFPLFLPSYLTLEGAGADSSIISFNNAQDLVLAMNQVYDTLRDLGIKGHNQSNTGLSVSNSNIMLENIMLFNHEIALKINGSCNLGSDSVVIRDNNYGVQMEQAVATLANMEIRDNSNTGIDIRNSDAELKNLLVSNNNSQNVSASLMAQNSEITVLHCDFLDNRACGAHLYNCNGLMLGNLWQGNGYYSSGSFDGGGVYLSSCQTITFINDRFENNLANGSGGGVYAYNSFPVFAGCLFKGNHAGYGGGLYLYENEGFGLVGCRLEENVAEQSGGGIYDNRENGYLSGSTIAYNLASSGGGICYANYSGGYEWDGLDRCNIYLNNAWMYGYDLYSADYQAVHPIVVDTFTVIDPTDRLASQTYNFDFDILHGLYELGDVDIYVSPDGNDRNSGFTPQEALKTLTETRFHFSIDTLPPHTIHLAEGTYSPSLTGENWPVEFFSGTEILGAGRELTILDGEMESPLIINQNNPYSLDIKHLTIKRGHADVSDYGGAIYCKNGWLGLEDVLIDSCSGVKGGALSTYQTDCRFRNVEFRNNTAEIYGGAWYARGYTDCDAENTVFRENGSVGGINPDLQGGAIFLNDVSGSFRNLLLEKNCAKHGGAISLLNTASLNFFNTAFLENSALGDGGAVHGRHARVAYNFSTFGGNTANLGKDLALRQGSDAWLDHIILGEDVPESVIDLSSSTVSLIYSNLVGGEAAITQSGTNNYIGWHEGNIDADPLFVGSGDYPYSLSAGSPCIDAGNPDTAGMNLPFWDLAGNYRLWDGDTDGDTIVDMGAYEFGSVGVGTEEFQIPSTKFQTNSKFQIEIYPNPVNDMTMISFSLKEETRMSIELINYQGIRFEANASSWFPKGENKVALDVSRLPSGVYLLRVGDGESVAVTKLVKL